MFHNIVIIAAGGKGTRMGSDLPKQYQLLNDRPVLMHTIEAFDNIADRVVLVIHPEMEGTWKKLCEEYGFQREHDIVFGGSTRFASVRNGLQFVEQHYAATMDIDDMTIAVHDAARPLVDPALIVRSFELARQGKGNVLGIRSTNTVRLGTAAHSTATNREEVWLIQTPQTFPAKVLFHAFQQQESKEFTDEASVVEKMGYNVLIVESSPKNIKITYPEDFAIAQSYTKTN